jgi:hypothetical protein
VASLSSEAKVEEQPEPAAAGLSSEAKVEEQLEPAAVGLSSEAKVEEQPEPAAAGLPSEAASEKELRTASPDLLAEIENNHRIATQPWVGQLLSFQTSLWDTSQDEVHTWTTDLRDDLKQAYADMHLANSIVWLSTELGRRSQNLDENYIRLCTSVAARLARVVPLLK